MGAILSHAARSNYLENSHKSLRLSLPVGENLRFLGRSCKIPRSQQENSLPNSLHQGILVDRSGHKIATFGRTQQAAMALWGDN